MHPAADFLKYRFSKGLVDAKFYNEHIFPAVQQGIIKDITPKGIHIPEDTAVWAEIEFPDGSKFRLIIRKKQFAVAPFKSKDYDIEISRIGV
jgi:hypothetical protein